MHTDVCGSMSIHARDGFIFFITIIDDHSRFGYLYMKIYKSKSFEKFREFRNEEDKQLGRSIKSLRLDPSGKYLSQEFLGYLWDNEILSK